MVAGGYCGKMLEVDLTAGTVTTIPLPPEDVLRKYVGGAALGLHMLRQRLNPAMRCTDPETPLIFMTGPLTGTKAPNSSDWTVVTLNGQISYAPAVSHCHGHFGARLKHAGYDGVLVRGAAPRPVYLWIDDDKAELRDAADFWGMDTFETVQALREHHGDPDNISVACIGPAGEERMLGASIRSDLAYGANKGGAGIAMGAKRFKAIAVRGTGTVAIADKDAFLEVCAEWRTGIKGRWYDAHGLKIMPRLAELGTVPAMNFTDPGFQVAWGKRLASELKEWKVTGVGSWECEFNCHTDVQVTTGPYAGTRVIGYFGEVIEDGATNIGIEDPGTGVVMSNFYDAMGCDPAEVGRLIAMSFELYNKGLLSKEETGGLDLSWGNDEAARELLLQVLHRQPPLGDILAKGYKEAIRLLGKGDEDMFVHIKGAGFNSHDMRAYGLGFMLGLMVSGAGPTWQSFGVEKYAEPSIGYKEMQDPATPEGKAEAAYKTAAKKLFEDSTGICFFACLGVPEIGDWLPRALALATGWDFDWQEGLAVGERVVQMQRLIAIGRGFEKKNDFEISERMLVDAKTGPAAGRVLKPHLSRMINEYYGFAGWDQDTGAPKPETLERLGLADRVGAPA